MRCPTTVPVLIAGGGPIGLTLSVLLSDLGVDHLLVEARPGTTGHPKSRGISARSMEILRRCGLEEEIRAAGLPADQVAFYRGRSLVDPEFTRTSPAGPPSDGPEHSPTPGLICSQDALEPVLLRRARRAGPDRVRFGTRLLSFTDSTDSADPTDGTGSVHAVLADRESGDQFTVRADWLIGCDGAASTVRAGAGLALDGPTGLRHFLSIRFEAPLGPVVADRASASYFLTEPGRGGFLAVDNDRQWIYQYPVGPAGPAADAEPVELVRAAAGLPGLDVRVRSVQLWRMDAQLASAYRRGRVLLAGDAAHVIPPTGGHGMNTGIGDVDNLAWKLAAVLGGRAGQALLDSYQDERRPVARQVLDRATENAEARAARGGYRIDDELLLTADYRSSAVLADPADGPARPLGGSGRPGGAPGQRLPHVRLTGPAEVASSLDLVGPGFALVVEDREAVWRAQAADARAAGIPVAVHRLDPAGPLREERPGTWRRLCAVPDGGAVLLRPDGHIGWRAPGEPAPGELLTVLRRLLSA
ncbi:FAD-dependent monooxygenase [Kitasatospora sp. NPDC052896]|uniref:FAD-dependent monooxygenase n=1 Tax=Kitasatospora sp. NPDC052896 TaxID=3364061 RepID=UPI0037C51510